eukprot:5648886-Karenia_brevis.AAC.1
MAALKQIPAEANGEVTGLAKDTRSPAWQVAPAETNGNASGQASDTRFPAWLAGCGKGPHCC